MISPYSTGISKTVKVRNAEKLQLDIQNDAIIRKQIANLGCLLVCTSVNFLGPILVSVHTVNKLDSVYENEGSEGDLISRQFSSCLFNCSYLQVDIDIKNSSKISGTSNG